MNENTNETEKKQISDAEALDIFKTGKSKRAKFATKYVTRTVVYPVEVYYKPNVPTREIRIFVKQGSHCSDAQWEKAQALEKKYPELQKEYRTYMKNTKGVAFEIKDRPNILQGVPVEGFGARR